MIKKFTLGAKRYKVERNNQTHNDALGKAYSDLAKIVVFTKWGEAPGTDVPEDSQLQTLMHEVTHCIFDEIGRGDLSRDETLVQSFAVLLHQFMETSK